MKVPLLSRQTNGALATVLASFALVASLLTFSPAPPAEAAPAEVSSAVISTSTTASATSSIRTAASTTGGAISCGEIQCSIDATVRGESDWESTVGSGGSGSTGSGTSKYKKVVTRCSSWAPTGGGIGTGTYPAENSGSYTCFFPDSGHYSAGQGSVDYKCPPYPDRAAYARVNVYDRATNTYMYYLCLPPTDTYAPVWTQKAKVKLFYKVGISFLNTGSNAAAAARTNGGGVEVDSESGQRTIVWSNCGAYDPNYGISYSPQTAVKNGAPYYGYHRLQTTKTYRLCYRYEKPSWLHVPPMYTASTTDATQVDSTPNTYACNLSPALRSGIVPGALFNPTDCARPYISCVITGQFYINGVTTPTEVMRDNKNVPARLGTTTVNANPNYIDIDKVAKFMTITVDNRSVSPSNPDGNVNSSKPYYSMWQTNGTTKINFGEPVPQAESIFLSWLTDSAPGRSWQATETASLRALAYLPTQTGMAWVPIEPVCSGALTSNPVSAVRSVNNH